MLSAGKTLGVAVLALLVAGPARADRIAFTAWFTGNDLTIQNDSDLYGITAVSVTIGDTAYNYDASNGSFSLGSGSFVLADPDSVDDALRSDVLSYTFTGFDPGERFVAGVDIDPDSGNSSCCTLAGVLFNNGDAANAEVMVSFTNDLFLAAEAGDTLSSCAVFGECSTGASFELPEPGLLLLLGASAVVFAALRRRSA